MDLSAQMELLKVEIKSLREENAFLRRKVSELEDKLNINSNNSGLPTSKEIYKKEKKNRLKSTKRPGGQFGHQHNIVHPFVKPFFLIHKFFFKKNR